jgi:hypothetical protein
VTLILFRVDATSNVHQLDFNKRILILKMHGPNIKKSLGFASTVILRIFCVRGDRLSRLILLICFLNPSMQIPKEYPKFHDDGYLSNPSQVIIYFNPIICCCKLAGSATAGSDPG